MIWVTWRQHRTEVIVAGTLLVLFALFLLLTGIELRKVYLQDGRLGVESFAAAFPFMAIHILPFLLGGFIGAPLVSQELERGTYRLAWTQGITREQWFKSKLTLVAGATLVIFLFVAGILNWWNLPVNETIGPWATFDANGIVIFSHALFALALGIALGTFTGKPVGAMALFVPIFPIVRLFFFWLRQYYLPPLSLRWNYTGENPIDRLGKIWILEQNFIDQLGKTISSNLVFKACRPKSLLIYAFNPDLFSCFRGNGFSIIVNYQPVERFWLFQGIECLAFLFLTVSLVGLTVWWLKKKVS
jgi:ABC-type transport system involved in multi-copper enzyme maturation permease subunit